MKAESKAIIFGRYLGQKILHNSEIRTEILTEVSINDEYSNYVIQLKPLSSISDEDAKLFYFMNAGDFLYTANIKIYYDPLRQLGYATPQTVIEDGKVVTYTVEELVSNGTFKLD